VRTLSLKRVISGLHGCFLPSTGKADLASRRNEKLAKRNPDRIQKQIDDLKAVTTGGGKLTKHEEQVLAGLEQDLKSVQKAREALGDKAPQLSRGPRRDGGHGILGKRRRDTEDGSSDDEDVPEEVKSIPMPRDTPPPIPKQILDEWYARRRARRNANQEPLGDRVGLQNEVSRPDPAPVIEAKTVYESKPVVRDLRQEAVSAFVPAVVRTKLEKAKGQGGLLEPEEADRLEAEGYLAIARNTTQPSEAGEPLEAAASAKAVTVEEVEDEG
jgi:hypothetical protein